MEETLRYLLYTVIIVAVPVVTKYFVEWLREKTKETKLEEIADIVASVVEETNQTYVDALKEAGEFTEEAQAEALQRSLSKAVSLLSDDLKNLILKYSDDVESYLTTLIESYIKINE